MNQVKLTFLGTGTSQGVPVIGCKCSVCKSTNFHDNRLRSSALIQVSDLNLVIDTGPDFRQQMLRFGPESIDAILFTHEHKDHIAGLDDVRAFNFVQKRAIDVYASAQVEEALRREYAYIFSDFKYPGIPQITVKALQNQSFLIGQVTIQPILVWHYKMPVFGFRIGNIAYITDANYIEPQELAKLAGCQVLILNALRTEKHISHFNLSEAIALAQQVGAERTYFTHISHQLGLHQVIEETLPAGMFLAFDGLQVATSI